MLELQVWASVPGFLGIFKCSDLAKKAKNPLKDWEHKAKTV